MNIALKEWSVICVAMKQGVHHFLLRKGGLADAGKTFNMEHKEFLFFPTLEHQKKEMISEQYFELFKDVQMDNIKQNINIDCWAKVQELFEVKDFSPLKQLKPLVIWSDDYFKMRFNYKPEKPLFLAFLRVYILNRPKSIANLARYGGCRSWVTIEEDIDIADSKPVISDREFKKVHELIIRRFSPITLGVS